MALKGATKDYNTFVKGIITENSALNFPENASLDEENFVLNADGSRQRRKGINLELNGVGSAQTFAASIVHDQALTINYWKNAGNTGGVSFYVVQVGSTINFIDATKTPVSGGTTGITIDLNDYKTVYAQNIGVEPIQTAVGNGVLYIVSKDTDLIYVTYDNTSGIPAINTPVIIDVQDRDFLGLDDLYDVDERRVTPITSAHHYNLLNQGWLDAHITTYEAGGNSPSNADIWILGKDSNDLFSAAQLDKVYVGDTPAPKGHFKFSVFDRNYNTKVSPTTTDLTSIVEENRFSTTAFYSGRLWLSGVESNIKATGAAGLNSKIYYSQLLTDKSKAGKCYQEADPTSEQISDLIATDGGVIVIPEIERVWKLVPMKNSLIVFASNGIWQIRGSGDSGFDATTFEVLKLLTINVYNADCVIVVEDSIMFWTDAGIYVLSSDGRGLFNATNISKTTIQTLYNNISNVAKLYARGSYDATGRIVSWLYNDSSSYDGATDKYFYDTELLFDVQLQAFYKHTFSAIGTRSPNISGQINSNDLLIADIAYGVEASGVSVEATAVAVEVTQAVRSSGTSSVKYWTFREQVALDFKMYMTELNETTFVDWLDFDGTGADFVSFLRTGHEVFGDPSKIKQVKYLTMYFKRTETGFTESGGGPD